MKILGISAFYHDSAAALVIDGRIIAAAQEERFSRVKHDERFPVHASDYCLREAGINWEDLDAVVYYDKPWLKFERILETYYALAPKGAKSFRAGLPVWIKEKAMLPRMLQKHIPKKVPLRFSSHHLSHAASAFYPSPFKSAAILTLDGVGEWATTTIAHGVDNQITIKREMKFPHSIGLLYSSFTQYCGFKVNSGEYKLMGLAPYGRHGHKDVEEYKRKIKSSLVHIYDDGGIWLDQNYFSYTTGLEMVEKEKWSALFGFPMREPESPLTQTYCDLALAIQEVTEEIVIKLARQAKTITNEDFLCLAGGVALNCVANGVLRRENIFKDIWIQPAAGDAGGAPGAALAYYYSQNERETPSTDQMIGSYLGPQFGRDEIIQILNQEKIFFSELSNSDLCTNAASLIAEGNVLGWFQGRMEFGPRALGGRSILADARSPDMQKKLNLKIKNREGFRPFAPSVLAEDMNLYFEGGWDSPYMLLVDKVKNEYRNPLPNDYFDWPLDKRLYFVRSQLPAITHLDFSARVQSVHKETNPLYHQLITSFKKLTGWGVIVNTSFNVRGEPIVGSTNDALRCLFQTEMDALAIGPFLILKKDQSQDVINDFKKRKSAFALD
ncbi:MAG: carbamoyltransferase [Bacteriovoracaceae bacterium]|nr:carbamoyltransferase [Bacteriovoracaceae bacterium]